MSAGLRRLVIGCAAGASLALAGCATTSGGGAGAGGASGGHGVEVTRFHLEQAIAPGEIAIEPRDPAMAASLEFRDYANSVDAELQRLGFKPAPTVGASELVATIDVHRGTREQLRRPGGLSIGVGGGSFGYHGGVGGDVGVTVPVGGGARMIVGTEVSVQIKRRSDGTVIWEGRARTEAPAASPISATVPSVQRAIRALFTGYPGESGRTILIR